MGTFLNESMHDLSVSLGLFYISFLQISCVFLSLKPNCSDFHNFKLENRQKFSKMYFSDAQVHWLAATAAVALIILIASMLLKKRGNKIKSVTSKFQVFNFKIPF